MKSGKRVVSLFIVITAFFVAAAACTIESDYTEKIAQYNIEGSSGPSFTVTYDGNGNTGGNPPVDDLLYKEGDEVTVHGNTNGLVKDGYDLIGWNTASDGSGLGYTAGETFVMDSQNLVLYAQWEVKVYTITYDGNGSTGGNVPVDVNTYEEGELATILGNINGLIKSGGYTFVGWNSKIDGTGTAYNGGSLLRMGNTNIILYAQWSVSAYELTATAGTGGSIATPSPSTINVAHGAATNIVAVPDSGYSFSGWAVTFGSATINDPNAASTTVTLESGDATVTASFTLNTYELTISVSTGGSITEPFSSPVTVSHGMLTDITAAANTGYNFTGWSVLSGTATIADPDSLSTTVKLETGDASIRANFAINVYQLTTIAATGGSITSPSSSPLSVDYNEPVTITAVPATGYNFTGWTVISGTASITNPASASTTVRLTDHNATVRANFSLKTYQLTIELYNCTLVQPASTPYTVSHGIPLTIETERLNISYYWASWSVVSGSASIADTTSEQTTVTLTDGDATIRALWMGM